MFLTAVAVLALAGGPAAAAGPPVDVRAVTDTTFDVPASGRVRFDMMNGSVRVVTWDRNAMRVRATHPSRTEVEIRRRGNVVDIEADAGSGQQTVEFEVTVPRRYGVEVDGINVRTGIDGVQGNVTIDIVEGSVTVANVSGNVNVESVSGDISLTSVRGNVSVNTTNKTVRLQDIRGDIEAETVNGSIVMQRIDAARVEASTVRGLVEYQGTLKDGGRYYLGTHNGRITLGVSEQSNARITISTHNGKVETAFPVQVTSLGSGEYSLVLGNGSARVQLESYNGSVYLVRPGSR